jgi:hypothetical protein
MKRLLRRARAEETGAALVMTLVFLGFIGVIAPALLDYSETSLKSTVGLRQARATVSGADSVLEGAINKVRSDRSLYTATDCFHSTINTVEFRVDCTQTATFTDNLHVTFTAVCLQVAGVAADCPSPATRGVANVQFSNATSAAAVRINSWSVK